MQIHDSHSLQCHNLITKIVTHPPDLTVQSLCEDDPEALFTCPYYSAGTCDRIKDWYPSAHATDEFFCHRFVYCNLIFLFVVISRFHDTVYQISLVGKEEKALGIFIQASYRIYPNRIVQIFHHCHLITLLPGAANDPSWFIKKKQDLFFLFLYGASVNTDLVVR